MPTAPLITISITNRQKSMPIDRRRIRRAVSAICRDAEILEAQISVAVVDDPTISELHQKYLNDTDPTDVLSFVLEQSPGTLEGEVVVSADTALACAPRYGCSADEELLRYVIHGTLHLVGYDDTTPRKRAVMRKKEQRYLRLMIDDCQSTIINQQSSINNLFPCPPKKPRPS